MKKILLSISLLALAYTASANVPVIKSDPKIEAQVEQTLKKLTLEEKIGQMMELVTDLFGANDKNGVFYIDEHKTDSILSRYKIGSILNAPNTCAPTAKQWEKYYRTNPEDLDEAHRHPLCLRSRPEPRFYLYTGWNPLPAEHQCGCHL